MAAAPRTADEGRPRSASTWIGCGCALVVAIFMLGVVAVSWMTYRAGKGFEAMTGDPERAAAEIRETLPYDELPPGYRPIGALEIPFLLRVAFIGGPGAAGDPDAFEHGFFVVRIRDWFGRGERTADWLEGAEVEMQPIEQQEFTFRPREVVARGELTAGGAELLWLARRGEVRVADLGRRDDEGDGEGGGEGDAASVAAAEPNRVVLTMVDVDCDDGWQRLGLWFEPDPTPDAAAAEVDWSGTPADPAALAEFLSRFGLCG